jgi:cyanophycin synthetase
LDRSEPAWSSGIAHLIERAALSLQVEAGCPVSFSRTAATVESDTYMVIVEYSIEEVGLAAFDAAVALCRAVLVNDDFDVQGTVNKLKTMDEDLRLGPSTGAIVKAAVERGIPISRLNKESLVQLGWGKKLRRILAAETDQTSAVAESIAQDKDLTKTMLSAVGVPVPEGQTVTSREMAWEAAQEIGFPVVVKPRHGSQGRGVAVHLETRDQVMAAFDAAFQINPDVLVERWVTGHDYRLLVIGWKFVAAARRDPPLVTGDGLRTVRQLVDLVNADPKRTSGHATSLSRIPLDDVALSVLEAQGLGPDSVPVSGALVYLRRNANLSTGGIATDVTEEVHPEVRARAVAAAKVIGLDVCGVDVLCDRIDRPLEEQGGVVIEVNAAPGLRMHLDPSYGRPRAVGKAFIAHMFKNGDNGRIPVVAVSGTNGKTTTVRLIAHILGVSGTCVGLACTDGIYVAGKRVDTGDCSGPRSAHALFLNPMVEAAVLETARGGILRNGLGWDRCDVAVVTNIGTGDHLGLEYITTTEDLAVVKRVLVQNVSPTGSAVLNAADPHTAAMARACPGSVVFFAADREHPVLVVHRASGGRVVFVDGGDLVAREGTFEYRIPLAAVPLTRNGAVPFQVENAMAALGAVWALHLDWDVIRSGLATFETDIPSAPGRFNVMEIRGATVIADYGHNADAIAALARSADAFPSKRRIVVISAPGDRRDSDIRRQGEILGDAFDEVILYQDQCQRGRADGEVLALLREGLANAKRTKSISEIRGEFLAIETGLSHLEAGDLCLLLVDQVSESLQFIQRLAAAATPVIPRKY